MTYIWHFTFISHATKNRLNHLCTFTSSWMSVHSARSFWACHITVTSNPIWRKVTSLALLVLCWTSICPSIDVHSPISHISWIFHTFKKSFGRFYFLKSTNITMRSISTSVTLITLKKCNSQNYLHHFSKSFRQNEWSSKTPIINYKKFYSKRAIFSDHKSWMLHKKTGTISKALTMTNLTKLPDDTL